MWTPKRILLLCACFVTFFTVYLGYAYSYVGRIDGLPPLPDGYGPNFDLDVVPEIVRGPSKLELKIKQAFGAECKEQHWAIRLELHARNMVLASEHFQVVDGRVVLAPLSVAVFGKPKGDGLPPEINTIRSTVAYLKFDRHVSNFSEITSRKIVEAELTGQIEVASNRRRIERDEDLRMSIATGTLYYREETHRIWTEAWVDLVDHKSKPEPHRIRGKGMEMEMLAEAPPAPGPGQPPRKPGAKATITGVKWVELRQAVDMHLYAESGQGGLMGSQPGKPAAPPLMGPPKPVTPGQRAHLHITTPGKFRFEIYKDHDLAHFDVAAAGSPRAAEQPRHVEVVRTNQLTNKTDHLVCHHLTLRMRRKEAEKKADAPGSPAPAAAATPAKKPEANKPGEGGMESLEIETVHATAHPGKEVVLVSNAENLAARGTDFFHDTIKHLTILKGAPVNVDKEDNKIVARELRILTIQPTPEAAKAGARPYQNITAYGPGDILMSDKKEKKTMRAGWQNLLTMAREGNLDLLTLTGEARFVDELAEQSLKADVLKVWLEEADKKQATAREGATDSRRPRHLEATGNVVGRSRDMNIHDTSRLVVWFKDVPASTHLPAGTAAREPRKGTIEKGAPDSGRPGEVKIPNLPEDISPNLPKPLPAGPARPGTVAGQTVSRPGDGKMGPELGTPDTRPQARPFDLSARSIETWVLRSTVKSTVDQLWCEGSVHGKQDPAKAEEKGTEVKGDTLRMTAAGDNLYFLVVTGDLAELQTDKVYIIGPEVNVDQSSNKAWVIGDGAMKMDSLTNFQGDKLEKPVPLTVHWSKSMLFNGESAEFHGNIQAVQEKARLACQHLQVYFDRPISLRQGNKTDQPARVRNLVCDRDVRVEETLFKADKIEKYTRLEGPVVQMIALEADDPMVPATKANSKNMVTASGPGNIRIWEPGTNDDPVTTSNPTDPRPAKPKGSGAKSKVEMKMTLVSFLNRMDANSATNMAQFWGGVRVIHMPAPRHDMSIDLDALLASELPERTLYIRCDRLKVLDRPTDGKPNKQMEAHGQVYTQGREFYGRADSMYYNQQKQQVILEARENGQVSLYKFKGQGGKPEEVVGKQIIYNRSTGQTEVIGGSSITGESMPKKSK